MIKVVNMKGKEWVVGISDGLTLPCKICGVILKFDYRVKDEFWSRVVSEEDKRDVICLSCLDELANKKGLSIIDNLIDVQFTGINKTIELIPNKCYVY